MVNRTNLRLKGAELGLRLRAQRLAPRKVETMTREQVIGRLWRGWRVVGFEESPLTTRVVLRKGPLWASFTLSGIWNLVPGSDDLSMLRWDDAAPGEREQMIEAALLMAHIAGSAEDLQEALSHSPDRYEQTAVLLSVVDEQVSSLRQAPDGAVADIDQAVYTTRLSRLNDEIEARFYDQVASWVEDLIPGDDEVARARRDDAWSAATGEVLDLVGDTLDQWRRDAANLPDGVDAEKATFLDEAISTALDRVAPRLQEPAQAA